MLEVLKKTYPFTASDIDCHRHLRLSALLSYMQNMATEHAVILQVGGDKMIKEYGAVWMMARLHLELMRPIRAQDEEIEIHTWHRGAGKSTTVFRDFDLFVRGERVGEAVTSWVVVDMKERRLIKPDLIPELVDSPKPERVKDITPRRVKMPAELQSKITRTVTYSDTDINGHMNNTKYADIACDVMSYDQCTDQFITEVQISYLKESFPGDKLSILHTAEDCTHYICGRDTDGDSRFEIRIMTSLR